MLFVATLTHNPDHCWAREEYEHKARDWIASIEERADELGVAVQGAYVTPSEHRFYFVLDADDFGAVSSFLGPPLLTDHEAHIAPVLSLEQAVQAVLDEDSA